jgi:glycosyltransferase involved in cell wall biosynthesis
VLLRRSFQGSRTKVEDSDFSVVITSHNQAEYICQAVESALSQVVPAKEVIVVDDASTDGSRDALRQYESRISVIQLPANHGANVARNTGAFKAHARYLVFLDGDDAMSPWALEVYSRVVKARKPKVILSSLHFFSGPLPVENLPRPQTIRFCEYDTLMRKDRPYRASASAIVVDRDTFLEAGGWTENIFPMEDLDLIIKLGYSGRTVQILSPPTKYYRVHPGNTVRQIRNCIAMMTAVLDRERRSEYPGGRRLRMERSAFIGGPAWFWVKKGFRTGFYADALRLFVRSWNLIAAGAYRRLEAITRGRRPMQSIELGPRQ